MLILLKAGSETLGIGEDTELINFSCVVDSVHIPLTYKRAVHDLDSALNMPRRKSIVSMTRTRDTSSTVQSAFG
jgi:hypothetical protein